MSFGKFLSGGIFLVGLMIFGFIFLLRACLAQFDERFAIPPGLYFEKGTDRVLLSLVQFNKTDSYSSENGVEYKSVTGTYFLQLNNPETGEKLKEEKLKDNDEIEERPVEVLGASDNKAWIFAGELMAFDPFSLKTIADKSILEQKNPALEGILPKERRFYQFNYQTKDFYITGSDGTKWKLDANTLKAEPFEFDKLESKWKTLIKSIEAEEKKNQSKTDSLFMQIRNVSMADGAEEYFRKAKVINNNREGLYKIRDSLNQLKSKYRERDQNEDQLRRTYETLQRMNVGYSSMRSNQDTVEGQWYGIYSQKELDELYQRVQASAAYEETARRNFYATNYYKGKFNELLYNKEESRIPTAGSVFLQGGFLLDKESAQPFHLSNPTSFLVVSKDKIGNNGSIILTRIDFNGKKLWEYNSNLPEWVDWRAYDDKLFIFGADNKEIGSHCSLLQILDLSTSKVIKYDYFEDKLRKTK
jgi:hypothetical protein